MTNITRRTALKAGFSALGGLYAATAFSPNAFAQSMADTYKTANGSFSVHPVSHASMVLNTDNGVIYIDPVGGFEKYADLPKADMILLTHEHADHLNVDTLIGLVGDNTKLLTNPAVLAKLPGELAERASAIGNGDKTEMNGVQIEAVAAYNLAEERLKYHPKGRDNGYVLSIDGSRVYIAGDTEAVPEMRELTDIDVAFVPMNLPYTMGVEQAAEGVADFAPAVIYPYHYKGADLDVFEALLAERNEAIKVVRGAWYT
jgi:L-ascorbate metabolism protein UlaG (beta-lactamase superfamily)